MSDIKNDFIFELCFLFDNVRGDNDDDDDIDDDLE